MKMKSTASSTIYPTNKNGSEMTWSYNYITAAVWTAGFHWWRFGNKKQMQNVSQYMLVLALFLVNLFR